MCFRIVLVAVLIFVPECYADLYCEEDWVGYADFCYKVTTKEEEHKPWPSARQACIEYGHSGDLASFQSEQVYIDVMSQLPIENQHIWLGFNDIRGGNMTWSDDRAVAFTKWSTGQPDNHIVLGEDGESCTEIFPNSTWNDNKCGTKIAYMCQKYKGYGEPQLPKTMCLANSSLTPIRLNNSGNDIIKLESPNYPYFYPLDQLCLWTIEAEDGHRQQIEFETFSLIGDIEALSIGNGNDPDNADSVIVERGRMMSLHVLNSNGNKVWMRWITNDTILSSNRSYEYWVWKNKNDVLLGLSPNTGISNSSDFGFRLRVKSFNKDKPDCPKDDFACDNGNCVYTFGVCNGINDCLDNSDEQSCNDAAAIVLKTTTISLALLMYNVLL
ncbi:uncharacterized protein [Amphiura filiformis]|uniref:uncharacterized protein n=1 Tax=Amphiura filiformis TaxID=82378 RepID=UPI003B22798B